MIFMPSSLLVWCRWWGEEGRLTGSRRRSNNSLVSIVLVVFFDFIVVVVVLDVVVVDAVVVIFVIAYIKVIRNKGTRAKPKHREGRTSDRFHVANSVPQRCGK